MQTNIHLWSDLAQFFLGLRFVKMFETEVAEKIKTRILYSITSFFFRNLVAYETR
jgi:hypothetical protein